MSELPYKYIWRCINCSSHFVSITKVEGVLKQEKKCSKCKALNVLVLSEKEIIVHCKTGDSHISHSNHFNQFDQTEPKDI